MTTISVSLPDDRLERLQELARSLQLEPEELVRASIDDLLVRSDREFTEALRYVLKKNAELYRRLA
jgi:antitoxin FitA